MIGPRPAPHAATIALLLALVLVGCAPLPPAPGGVTAPPVATTPKPPSNRPSETPQNIVPQDSTPSTEALAVLATIPEPLRSGEQVAPLRDASGGAAPGTRTEAANGGSAPSADVPVPGPVQVLGERRPVPIDSTGNSASGANTAAAPMSGGSPAPASGGAAGVVQPTAPHSGLGAAADTCWRVQILAPLNPAVAEQARATATSQLLLPMVIEREQGRYKVRSKDCLTRLAADLLRRRAIDSGFGQAFRISSVAR